MLGKTITRDLIVNKNPTIVHNAKITNNISRENTQPLGVAAQTPDRLGVNRVLDVFDFFHSREQKKPVVPAPTVPTFDALKNVLVTRPKHLLERLKRQFIFELVMIFLLLEVVDLVSTIFKLKTSRISIIKRLFASIISGKLRLFWQIFRPLITLAALCACLSVSVRNYSFCSTLLIYIVFFLKFTEKGDNLKNHLPIFKEILESTKPSFPSPSSKNILNSVLLQDWLRALDKFSLIDLKKKKKLFNKKDFKELLKIKKFLEKNQFWRAMQAMEDIHFLENINLLQSLFHFEESQKPNSIN